MCNGAAEALIEHELRPGERLLWSGRRRGSPLTLADAVLVPLGVIWLAFVVVWTGVAVAASPSPLLGLFGLPFIAVGLFFAVGRFWLRAWMRRNTVYGVTSERVIEKVGGRNRWLPLTQLPAVQVISHGGRGNIVFASTSGMAGWFADAGLDALPGVADSLPMAFIGIEDVRSVGGLIEGAAASGAPDGPAPPLPGDPS